MAAIAWNDKETLSLIEFWGDESIQSMLEGCTRNKHVYERLASEMDEAGYNRSWTQCRDKLKKLKGDYKKVKDHNDETGRGRKTWKFFESMDSILGTKPAFQPETIIDTLQDEGEKIEDNDEFAIEETKDVDDSIVNVDELEEKPEVEKENQTKSTVKQEVSKVKKPEVGRKRKTKESSRMERALKEVVELVTEAQKKSDELFISLEEKRMKFDEQILLMEDQQRREDKEREDRRWKEEREREKKDRGEKNVTFR